MFVVKDKGMLCSGHVTAPALLEIITQIEQGEEPTGSKKKKKKISMNFLHFSSSIYTEAVYMCVSVCVCEKERKRESEMR